MIDTKLRASDHFLFPTFSFPTIPSPTLITLLYVNKKTSIFWLLLLVLHSLFLILFTNNKYMDEKWTLPQEKIFCKINKIFFKENDLNLLLVPVIPICAIGRRMGTACLYASISSTLKITCNILIYIDQRYRNRIEATLDILIDRVNHRKWDGLRHQDLR